MRAKALKANCGGAVEPAPRKRVLKKNQTTAPKKKKRRTRGRRGKAPAAQKKKSFNLPGMAPTDNIQ